MNNLTNIDISEVIYKYLSGVRNTLWGLVNEYLKYENKKNTNLQFYDTSLAFIFKLYFVIEESHFNTLFSKYSIKIFEFFSPNLFRKSFK
jgi:hypothetical protein